VKRKLVDLLVAISLLTGLTTCSRTHCDTAALRKNIISSQLELDYNTFDQYPGEGWRKIADKGNYLEAAELIDAYEKQKQGLEDWQKLTLRFHAGQMYAFANMKKLAITRFKTTLYDKEPPNYPIRWNAYVNATIAFLEKDKKKLMEFREEIAKGPMIKGEIANLDVVDRFVKYFDEPYSVAYRGNREKSE
jgi:hypothetical protein